jgi:hypothetical protein
MYRDEITHVCFEAASGMKRYSRGVPDTMSRMRATAIASLIIIILLTHHVLRAASVTYDLTIDQRQVNFTGKSVQSMTINGGIPGPTLRFKEGDIARIHVHNNMNVTTSIHWHGVLVPPGMDGVPYLSFPPIESGTAFTYEFPLRQSGTYWYHSHTGMQQQSGVYGAIVIEPLQNGPKPDHDYVVVLSDWTDENPHEVSRTLKRGSEWYALKKGSAQSIFGAAHLGMLGDYFARELQRMPAMDIADVAYDRFLANGRPEMILPAEPDETVRLRIIDGSSTTYFHLEFAGGPMTVISADGQDVEPIKETRLLVGAAETYDVLVQIPSAGMYEFRATAHDGSGYASVWIGSGERNPAPDLPGPNLYHTMGHHSLRQILSLTPAGTMGMPDGDVEAGKFDQPGMMSMNGMEGMHNGTDHSKMEMGGMDHSTHSMPVLPQVSRIDKEYGACVGLLEADVCASKSLAVDGMDPSRPWTPYARLRSVSHTAFSKDKPIREIRLTLDGDMERYVWFLNNKPLSESDSIRIREGEVVRFIMINRTMMHHPMHLHGHFFRVINDQGDHAPLKHTVDVAPMSTTVIEFDANEFGDWFFHCHLLYHMEAGMAGVVHYEGFTLSPQLAAIRSQLYRDLWYFWGQADILSSMTRGLLTLSNTRNILTAEWEAGWHNVDDTSVEIVFTWDRYINRFFSVFAGADVLSERNESGITRGILGLRYLLPLNLESRAWFDTDGGARFNLGRSFELTPRFGLFGEVEYDTHDRWEGVAGLSYTINKIFSLVGQWHSDYGFGGGLQIRF